MVMEWNLIYTCIPTTAWYQNCQRYNSLYSSSSSPIIFNQIKYVNLGYSWRMGNFSHSMKEIQPHSYPELLIFFKVRYQTFLSALVLLDQLRNFTRINRNKIIYNSVEMVKWWDSDMGNIDKSIQHRSLLTRPTVIY